MIPFGAEHRAVHYPEDRRFRIWIKPSIAVGTAVVIALLVAMAWIELGIAGLPRIPAVPVVYPNNFAGPHGFPLWVRYCHFFNFLFVTLLIRSGLSILADHPRLYFNDDCTPGSEWIRFTPIKVPRGRLWTAKDDARYLSPLIGTPGYRHTIGIARVWHFIENVLKPQCLLASEMNDKPLAAVYGAPLRLRVENQLGYKMVKWIERIEFVESEKKLGKGEGGKNEDEEYFDLLPNI